MKKFFTLCASLLLSFGAFAQDVDLESFIFTDLEGNEVKDGSTIVVNTVNEEGQMVVPLKAKNMSGEEQAVSMYETIDQMPNGSWQTCAFGNCMILNGTGYSPKNIVAADYNTDIQTEWIPAERGTWEATLQIHIFNITTKKQFGQTVKAAGDEIIAYGPKVTVRFESTKTVNMGSYSSDAYATQGSGLPNYVSGSTTVTIYQEIPAEVLKLFNGATMKQLRVAFALDQSTASKVYIMRRTWDDQIGPVLAETTIESPKKGWNVVDLDEPLTINTSDYAALWLGFTYTQTNSNNGQQYYEECFPLSIYAPGPQEYGMYASGLNNTSYGLNANSIYYLGAANLSVQAVVEGTFMDNAGRLLDYNSIVLRPGEEIESSIILWNQGTETINELSYVVTADGVASDEQTIAVNNGPEFNEFFELSVPFKAASVNGTEKRVFTVTKVNGKPNEIPVAESAGEGLVATTDRTVKKRVAVEEFTGTGCGWCPRGIVGMEMMREAYPDEFVGIAFHQYSNATRDAMYMPEYPNPGLSGAPSCMIDRQATVDPYYGSNEANFGVKDVFDMALQQQPKAGLEVKGEWTDDSTIKATATIESLIDGESYDIEYSLIADSLTGTGNTWAQSNYYYQYTAAQVGSDDLAPFCKGGANGKSTLSNWVFNDVAIATSFNSDGVNQAQKVVNAPDDDTIENTYTLSLPTKAALKKAIKSDKVWVVALLVDSYNGFVINAAKFRMPEYVDPSGIESTERSASDEVVERYSLDGRELPSTQKGLNIVRMADGSVRKVMVK